MIVPIATEKDVFRNPGVFAPIQKNKMGIKRSQRPASVPMSETKVKSAKLLTGYKNCVVAAAKTMTPKIPLNLFCITFLSMIIKRTPIPYDEMRDPVFQYQMLGKSAYVEVSNFVRMKSKLAYSILETSKQMIKKNTPDKKLAATAFSAFLFFTILYERKRLKMNLTAIMINVKMNGNS